MGDDRLTGWTYAYAVQAGASHLDSGVACQDHVCVQPLQQDGQPVFVATVSDGAGSAREAQQGAQLVSCNLLRCAVRHLESGVTRQEVTLAIARDWIREVVAAVAAQAVTQESEPRDFAATALLVIADAQGATCVQVGDGLIVIGAQAGQLVPGAYQVAIAPQRGEYANTTVFACDQDGIDATQLRQIAGPIQDVAVMSDGLQNLVLDHATQAAHAPFFDALLPMLVASRGASQAQINTALGEFLASARVAQRSDDDKSLILATLR